MSATGPSLRLELQILAHLLGSRNCRTMLPATLLYCVQANRESFLKEQSPCEQSFTPTHVAL